MHQRGGSLNIHELYQHYHQKPKGVNSQRVPNHQTSGNGPPQTMTNNMMGGTGVTNGMGPEGTQNGVYPLQN